MSGANLFETVAVGDLAAARSFQRGGPGFRAHKSAPTNGGGSAYNGGG
jgi:hypothetical protein